MTKNMFGSQYLHNLKINLVAVMANIDGDAHLNLSFQKGLSFNYEHHQENFKESISNDVRRWSSRNNEVLSFSEKFVLRDSISKSWI